MTDTLVAPHDWSMEKDGVWVRCPKCSRGLFVETITGEGDVKVHCPNDGDLQFELVGWMTERARD